MGTTCTMTVMTLDPAVCTAVLPEDARLMRERELEQLRLLLAACLAWEREGRREGAGIPQSTRDKDLLEAIGRFRLCR